MTLTSVPVGQSIIDVDRNPFPHQFTESHLSKSTWMTRRTYIDAMPGVFAPRKKKQGERKMTDHVHEVTKSLGDGYFMMNQNVIQNVAEGAPSTSQRVEQVLKTDRSWR